MRNDFKKKSADESIRKNLNVYLIILLVYIPILIICVPLLHNLAPQYGSIIIYLVFGFFSLIASIILFGFLRSTGTLKTKTYQFGGAAALFVVLFSLLVSNFDIPKKTEYKVSGTVFLDNTPCKGADVKLLEIEKSRLTNQLVL